MNAIELRNVTKRYQNFILEDINLAIPEGMIVGLVGENGAGKSTTIELILNVIKANEGEIFVFGERNEVLNKNEVGVVIDEAFFPDTFRIKEIEQMMKRTYQNWDSKLYFTYIERFQIPTKKKLKEFSKGMKMKLMLIVALCHEAKLLLLDEPTTGLDIMVREEFLDLFLEFTRNEKNTILISSHIVSDLEKICDYIAFLHKGKLVLMEEKDELLNQYAILKVTKEEKEDVPEEAIVRMIQKSYGYDLLVKKEELAEAFQTEHTTLEDIIRLLGKEEERG